jgi:RNA polymerase sigma-54 factor
MMELSQELEQELQTRVSPRLIAANRILALSSQELQETIAQEVDENPALDLVDIPVCPTCGRAMRADFCDVCIRKQDDTPDPGPTEQYLDDLAWRSQTVARDDEFDPLAMVAAQVTLEEKLMRDLMAMLSPERFPIAEYLVGSLDENGYLRCSAYEVCTHFDVEPEEVEEVLARLQSLDPPGIGARDLQECMTLQLRYLAHQGVNHPLAFRLVQDYLDDLGKHKFNLIARQMGVDAADVEEGWEFIRCQLNPHPAMGSDGVSMRAGSRQVAGSVMPDVIISEIEGRLMVEVIESRRFALSVNPMYRRLLAQVDDSSLSVEEREHIRHYVSRAKMFMSNILQRRHTMQKITEFLVIYQEDFLRHGVRRIKPLTRSMLAQAIGVHESTISRATASKYVTLPNGQVIPFSDFFVASLGVKHVIKEMISGETEPLTDQEIVTRLKESGHSVARRTVAKYRAQLGILPSSLR